MAIGFPEAKSIIKYRAIDWRKIHTREGVNWHWAYWAKSWSWNFENAIGFRSSDALEEDEEDIALANFIESLQKQTDEVVFFPQKSNWMIAVSYLMKSKIKKIFIEVISNTKIFYMKFCSMKLPTTKILSNLQVRMGNVEYGNVKFIKIII